MSNTQQKLDAVFAMMNRSWKPFPQHSMVDGSCSCKDIKCEHPAKHPMIRGWQNRAGGPTAQLTKWWTQWPFANIGIRTGLNSYLMVLDVDGTVGAESLRKLEERYGALPATLTSTTGKGIQECIRFYKRRLGVLEQDHALRYASRCMNSFTRGKMRYRKLEPPQPPSPPEEDAATFRLADALADAVNLPRGLMITMAMFQRICWRSYDLKKKQQAKLASLPSAKPTIEPAPEVSAV